ncbi:MAG: hypothetical protein M3Y56_02050 [Armatimonadota bacterium]|nr:hypothetical protein [Armatimonadota bacterium]
MGYFLKATSVALTMALFALAADCYMARAGTARPVPATRIGTLLSFDFNTGEQWLAASSKSTVGVASNIAAQNVGTVDLAAYRRTGDADLSGRAGLLPALCLRAFYNETGWPWNVQPGCPVWKSRRPPG